MLRETSVRFTESLLFPARLILLFLVLVRSVKDRAKQTTVQRCPINHHGILLIVPSVRHNRDNNVVSARHVLCPVVFAHVRSHERTSRVAEQIAHRIQPLREIQSVHSHRLFSHRRLVRISRRLIVVRKRNIRTHRSNNRRRMNLQMGMVVMKTSERFRNVEILGFTGVHKLDKMILSRREPPHESIPRGRRRPRQFTTRCEKFANRLGDEERTDEPTSLRIDPQFLRVRLVDDTGVRMNTSRPFGYRQSFRRRGSTVSARKRADPCSVNEDMKQVAFLDRGRIGKMFHAEFIVQYAKHRMRRGGQRNRRRGRQILDHTDRVSFGRFGGTDESILGIV